MPSIRFVPDPDAPVVSEHSRQVLRAVLTDAGLPSCLITGSARSVAQTDVIDIAPVSIRNPRRFLAALERARMSGRIRFFFPPAKGGRGFQVEIPQV